MKALGPDEGMNALRHPDCRFCAEYERLLRGVTAENRQLKDENAERRKEGTLLKVERARLRSRLAEFSASSEQQGEVG